MCSGCRKRLCGERPDRRPARSANQPLEPVLSPCYNARRMAEPYTVEELTRPEQFAALRPEWDALLERAEASLFQTWEWQWSWWRHFGRGRLCLLTARRSGLLAGIAPLMLGRYFGLPLRRLQFIGTLGTDYLDLILARG